MLALVIYDFDVKLVEELKNCDKQNLFVLFGRD
jgi:hypothetical protein